jgi:hypothetical protein
MPFPVAGLAVGAIARTAVGAAGRGAMTSARFGIRSPKGPKSGGRPVSLGRSLSSSQFSGTDPNVNITGPAVHEMLGRTPQ